MPDRVVSYVFRGNFGNLTAGLTAASRNVNELGVKMTALDKNGAKMRAGLTQVGATAGKVGLVAAAGFAVAVGAAANFDKAMSSVQAATHETAENMELLRTAAIKAGQDTKFSATEAANGIEELAKAGVSTKDILGGGLSGALDLAAAGSIDVADAAQIAATALTQFRLSGEDVPHVADLLAAAAGKAQGDVSDMSMALKQSGLVASQMGVSIEETTGTLAAFASAGLIGSDAGTSFRTMLLRLANPTKESAGLMNQLGIEAYNARGQFVGIESLAGQLAVAFKGQSQAQRDAALATLFGSDAIRAANVLYNQGAAGIEDWTNKVNDQGYAAETAAIKMDNLAGDIEQLKGSLETALIGAGSGSQGPLRQLVQGATDAVNAFNGLPPAAQNATTALLGITAVTGGALWFGSKVITGIADTKQALANLGVEAGRTKTLMAGIGKGLQLYALIEGINILDNKFDELFNRNFNESNLSRNLEALADGRTVDNLGKIGDYVRVVNAELSKKTNTFFGWLPGDTTFAKARDELDKIDQALAGMVESGNGQEAAAIFAQITEQAREQDVSLSDIEGTFGQYKLALDNANSSGGAFSDFMGDLTGRLAAATGVTKDASGATSDYGVATRQAAQAAAEEASALEAAVKAMRDKTNATLAAFDAETGYRQALKDARAQADKNSAGIKGNTDDALANRSALSQLASAWNNQSDAVKNNVERYKDSRRAFIETAEAMGVPTDAAKRLAARLLEIPKSRVSKVSVDGADEATRKVQALNAELAKVISKSITVTANVVKNGLNFGFFGSADGSTVPKTGKPYADRHPYLLADGEEVISNRYGQADRFRPLLKAINAGRLADGGTAGSTQSLDTRLEIVGLLQQIRDLRRDLDARIKKGKNKGELEVQGLERRRALLELEAAERDLRRAKNAEEREAREKAREQRKAQAELKAGMGDLFGFLPGREQTIAQQVASTIADFRKQWETAGGKWSKDLVAWADNALAAAKEYDFVTAAIEGETRLRDSLTQTLSEQQSAYNELTSTMKAFGDSVAGNFLGDVFNGQRTETVKGAEGPATAALKQARDELAALRASATGDSVQAAVQAAALIARINDLQAQSDAELQDTEVEVSGLDALRQKLAADTKNAQDFAAALQSLADKGLDTSGAFGGLYASLAQSGDVLTAQQMAALTAAQIDELEKAYKAREDAAAAVAAQTVQEKYGADQAAMQAAQAQTQAAIDQSTAAIELMQSTLPVIADNVRAGTRDGIGLVQPDIAASRRTLTAINGSINDLARQFGEQQRKDKI